MRKFLILFLLKLGYKSRYIRVLDKFTRNLSKYKEKDKSKRIKIMYGPTLATYSHSFAIDRVLANLLTNSHATVYPLFCDGTQKNECSIYGGIWNEFSSFKEACNNCQSRSKELWYAHDEPVLNMSLFQKNEDEIEIEKIKKNLINKKWIEYVEDDIPLGKLSETMLLNFYMASEVEHIENFDTLGLIHLGNLMAIKKQFERALSKIEPDRVICNDSFYGMWAVMQGICKSKSIPFYSIYPLTKDRICINYNDASINFNFRKSWKKFSNIDLSRDKVDLVYRWLNGNRSQKIDTWSSQHYMKDSFDFNSLDDSKPVALLVANVIWDAMAIGKGIFTKNMVEWILLTVDWFKQHPEFQLIIKPHPGETSPIIPNTIETIQAILDKNHITLSENIHILSSDIKYEYKDILKYCDVTLVYTTTAGIESSIYKIPTVLSGNAHYRDFGFTYDPKTKTEYFDTITDILVHNIHFDKSMSDKALKYLYFYQFVYLIKTGLFKHGFPNISYDNLKDVESNITDAFNYVVKSIIKGGPIFDNNSWPPES